MLNGDNCITDAPGSAKTSKMVLSVSSSVPHLVTRCASGQYKCDSKCLNWVSSSLCSHSIAVAELNKDLPLFLKWYNQSPTQPNITTVAMSGLPSGRGRKGGTCKRSRSRTEKKTPESYTLRPVFQQVHVVSSDNTEPTPSAVTQTTTASSSSTPLVQVTSSSMAALVGQINVSGGLSQVGPVPSCSTPIPTVNTNPFYVRFLQGNIRMCQGCRSTLRLCDGKVPAPPFDLVVARAERRSFRDKFGTLITPQKEQPSHYHLRLDCIRAVEPTFVSQALRVPQDIMPLINAVHREYLRLLFGLNFES